jgi:hypothetical protein
MSASIASSAIRLDGIRVLLAEDDADSQHVLTLIVETAGARWKPLGQCVKP